MLSNSFNHAFEDLFQYRDYYGTLWKHKSYQLIVQMSWGLIVESNSTTWNQFASNFRTWNLKVYIWNPQLDDVRDSLSSIVTILSILLRLVWEMYMYIFIYLFFYIFTKKKKGENGQMPLSKKKNPTFCPIFQTK